MSTTIYALVDESDVFEYLNNNTELIDDNGSMTDEELDALIGRIASKSADGRLKAMLIDALRFDWCFDKVLDVVDDCMYHFVAECLKEE